MRIAPPSFHSVQFSDKRNSSSDSMSQDFDRNIFSFSNGFERSEHQQQQIRRDKLRTQILEAPPPPLVGMEEDGIQSYIFSDMFNFASGGAATATELLESQPYRNPREADWFSHRQVAAADGGFEDSKNQTVVNDTSTYNRHQISSMNADSAAAMQLFLMNPQQQQRRSASPSPPPSSTGLHMSSSFHAAAGGAFGQFTWPPNNPNEILQGQGLSLSLSPSEELRLGLLFGQTPPSQYGGGVSQSRHLHVGLGPSFSALSNSKYTKAAQELLEEFCNVGRAHFKKPKANKNPISGGAGGDSPSSSKDHIPPVSASERLEHQRRKVKLSSMLDELDRRYNHYCERMQMVVNTFDMIMGFGAAATYTMLAQKAMSRHFRCLREAIADQMRLSSNHLGEKDGAKSGLTIGETPRLKFLEQRLRQQRAFHQMGVAEQEAWRPQRGLPQRSLTILRAWLFEHFLHPYPSDADKHLLARQTGLSKNQVANWFINARVRLWKPMVEEMYLQEAKDESEDQTATAAAVTPPSPAKINAHENDPSLVSFNTSENHPSDSNHVSPPTTTAAPPTNEAEACRKLPIESAMIRFGATSGDVSLTLGLRHDGNLPEKNFFSVGDFGSD